MRTECLNQSIRQQLLSVFQDAIAAVKPDQALLRHMRVDGDTLVTGGNNYDLGRGAVRVVGAGKGAAPMAQALENLLGDRISEGLIVVKYDHALPLKRIAVAEAAHPVPDAAGEKWANRILTLAGKCTQDDTLICLFTGGASALLPAPVEGVSLADLQNATSVLLASGADITDLNAVRKHLSRLGGGQLARAANGAHVISIIVSDVIGDDLATIASGPTAPDESTYVSCLEIIAKYGLAAKLPPAVMRHLEAGARGNRLETPKSGEKFFSRVTNVIVASNGQALEAAAARARQLGWTTHITPEPMSGEASLVALQLVEKIKKLAGCLRHGDSGVCLLAGGETTVTVSGNGKGGRNQEMALTASIAMAGNGTIGALFAGTDGTDGPTDAAGGFAFGNTAARMHGNAGAYLAANNSYEALKEAGALLITGPTLTNVMDIAILMAEAPDGE